MQTVEDQQIRSQINSNRNYGSLISKSDRHANYSNKCRSDEHINYQSELNSTDDTNEQELDNESLYLSSSELFVSQSVCQCSYIVEPVAFIQNLAASIMGFSLGQFIYNRIFTRLLDEASQQANNTNGSNMSFSHNLLSQLPVFIHQSPLGSSLFSNQTNNNSCVSPDPTNNNNNGSQLVTLLLSQFSTSNSYLAPTLHHSSLYYPHYGSSHYSLSPSDIDRIRTQAQEQTANLYFVSSLFSGIPVIIMTNLLGANCSNLGRKTLMLIYLFLMSLKFLLILLQCVYPEWPDWLFYLGAFIEGICGSGGVFYLALYCYISDYTSQSSRSFRITFLNNMNSLASLCVTFACGYVIKFYGYFYLFLASAVLMFIAFVYTVFLIPESLRELKSVSYWQRLKRCSKKRVFKSYEVYFNNNNNNTDSSSLSKAESHGRDEEDVDQNVNETSSLLERSNTSTRPSSTPVEKQTLALFLIIFANFIYNFGTNGISSIFTLFIMNAPYCFDSIAISHYSIFSTVFALVMSLFVSKFIRVNEVIICIISVASYFASVFCYIYGTDVNYIYLGNLYSTSLFVLLLINFRIEFKIRRNYFVHCRSRIWLCALDCVEIG